MLMCLPWSVYSLYDSAEPADLDLYTVLKSTFSTCLVVCRSAALTLSKS